MMNPYLSKQEKSNLVRLSVCLGLANEIIDEYAKAKEPDRDFMRYLKTGMTWMMKAVNRRTEFLDADAALDFAKQCSRIEPIIFVPNDKARKQFEEIRKIQGMITMSKKDLEEWYGMVIPFTCEKCDGKCKDSCMLRVLLAKYGMFPVNPNAVDVCQYSYADADSDISKIKHPLQQDDISPEDKEVADEALREIAEESSDMVKNIPDEEKESDEDESEEELCGTVIHMTSGRDIEINLPMVAAENICRVFHDHIRPVYAYVHDGDIFEVDLAKAEAIRCNGVGDIDLQAYQKPRSVHPNARPERDFTTKKSVHVSCQCGAEYDSQVPDSFTRVKCRDCGRWVYFNSPHPEHRRDCNNDFKDPVDLFGDDGDAK